MDIEEFIQKYKNIIKNNKDEIDFLTDRYDIEYVPYSEKVNICKKIVDVTTHNMIDINSEEVDPVRVFKSNRPARYMLFMLSLIDAYTDIDVDFNDDSIFSKFEMLDELDLANILILGKDGVGGIPTIEYQKFEMLMNMVVNDVTENEQNIVTCLDNKSKSISIVFDKVISMLGETLGKSLANEFSEMNENEKTSLFSMIKENIK